MAVFAGQKLPPIPPERGPRGPEGPQGPPGPAGMDGETPQIKGDGNIIVEMENGFEGVVAHIRLAPHIIELLNKLVDDGGN